jgi:hypothetical protein
MNNCYVYIHYRNDNNKPFYVGKGKGKRYLSKSSRNPHWKNIVNKVGYTIRIIENFLTEKEALQREKDYIKLFGRENLTNMTDGGEGGDTFSNRKHSDETKKKISESKKGKPTWNKNKSGIYSEETLIKMSKSKKGKTFSDDINKKKGTPNNKHNTRKISVDGIIYNSKIDFCKINNIHISTLNFRLKSNNFINYFYQT